MGGGGGRDSQNLTECNLIPRMFFDRTSFVLTIVALLLHSLFNFPDKTKMTYTAAATEEAIPATLGNGTHKGEECSPCTAQPSPSGLDSGQKAI